MEIYTEVSNSGMKQLAEENAVLRYLLEHPGGFWDITDLDGRQLFNNFTEKHQHIYQKAMNDAERKHGKYREGVFWDHNFYWEYQWMRCRIDEFGPFRILHVSENTDLNLDMKAAFSIDRGNYTDYIVYLIMRSEKTSAVLKQQVNESASVNLGTLIVGEKWTGRNSFAIEIHNLSQWKNSAFVRIRCEELTRGAVEKLFHIQYGRLVMIQKATLFFEEFHFLKSEHQKTILKFFSYSKNRKKFRLMASSIMSVEEMRKNRTISAKLLELFGEIEIRIPCLAEQKEHVLLMTEHRIHEMNRKYGWKLCGIEQRGEKLLMEYTWPGNLNQLGQVLDRVVANVHINASVTEIKAEWIEEALADSDRIYRNKYPDAVSLDGTLQDIERRVLNRVLQECDMNYSRAAKRLGIGRSTLYRKLENG